MKRIFKYICRKVDERIANKINNVTELIDTINDLINDKNCAIGLAIITGSVGVSLLSFSTSMFTKVKTMQ